MRRAERLWQQSLTVLLMVGLLKSAHAEPFLNTPTARLFPITCRWTCPSAGGGTYYHNATDYGTPTNSEILATGAGAVILVEDGLQPRQQVGKKPYGNHVRIRHSNGYETRYAHFLPNMITVQVGDEVLAGQLLGFSDNTGMSTGPHLHFEVRDPDGLRVNPYGDPPDYAGGCGTGALWTTCPPTPAPPPNVDTDNDGFTTLDGDCNDRNPTVNPDARERCNGLDDDCDGETDEDWRIGLSTDLDEPCAVGIGACENVEGTWECTPDGRAVVCSASSFPPEPEACNGLDDDCDGETDEDWRIGLAQDIGNPCTMRWETCDDASTSGTWQCAPNGATTVCDAPRPATATNEICNDEDDDCDGIVDNVASDFLRTSRSNCGACGNQCWLSQACIAGVCVDASCPHDWCLNYCNAVHCIDCGAGGCDLVERIACINDCGSRLPSDALLLNCLCHGGCLGYFDCR